MNMHKRLMDYAQANRTQPKWKAILYALCYGASVRRVLTGKWRAA